MKHISKILLLLSFALMGCEDYLDKQGVNTDFLTEDEAWEDREKILTIAYRLYDCTEWFFEMNYNQQVRHPAEAGKNYAEISCLSGETILSRQTGVVTPIMIRGNWKEAIQRRFGNPDFWVCWEDSWEAIYVANHILSRIDDVPTDILTDYERNQIKGEAFLFRGWAYYEINKRWGAMHYFKAPLKATDDYNLVRPELKSNREDVIQDLDSAIVYLQEYSYLLDPVYMGRLGKAGAMGLKSRALTTYASPSYIAADDDPTTMWKRAAKAAWETIEMSRNVANVGLYDAKGFAIDDYTGGDETQGNYSQMFHTNPGTIEDLWPRYQTKKFPQSFYTSWLWVNVGGYHGMSPTQELVDCFETKDGWPVYDDRYNAQSGYDDQKPYENRDPRFYHNILYHGVIWAKQADGDKIDMRTSPVTGEDRNLPDKGFTNSETGYLCRKRIPPKYNPRYYNTSKYVNAPYIRMAEMYLNYAEAVNEAYKDPNAILSYDGITADMSAVHAIDKIRDRVDMSPVRAEFRNDYLLFQERVRNEFTVELCFEYHLWHDQLRWKTAENYDNYDFHGVKVIEEDNNGIANIRYERFPIHFERHFDKDKHYRYPLRDSDLKLYNNLKQNPGWE